MLLDFLLGLDQGLDRINSNHNFFIATTMPRIMSLRSVVAKYKIPKQTSSIMVFSYTEIQTAHWRGPVDLSCITNNFSLYKQEKGLFAPGELTEDLTVSFLVPYGRNAQHYDLYRKLLKLSKAPTKKMRRDFKGKLTGQNSTPSCSCFWNVMTS